MSDNNFKVATVSVNAGINTFSIKDLEEDTQYLVEAFMVVPSGDTVYDQNDVSFITHSTMTDIDGNVYLTMRYGKKVWMTNNLRVTRYADGTPIEARGGSIGTSEEGPVYYYSTVHTTELRNPNFGLLYNWAAAVRADRGDSLYIFPKDTVIQGICPNGWHIPALNELDSITSRYKGSEMKTANWGGGDASSSNNYSQFSAEPAGFINYDDSVDEVYRMIGEEALFWTIDQHNLHPNIAFNYCLYSGVDYLSMRAMFKKAGYSIRCVKD
jgi:uncharacterized protein (TIGR02145 family)